MAKDIYFDVEARDKLKKGVDYMTREQLFLDLVDKEKSYHTGAMTMDQHGNDWVSCCINVQQ